jgi:hypothetical protein
MGAVPKWREEASDQRKRVMPTCALGGSRLRPAVKMAGELAISLRTSSELSRVTAAIRLLDRT